MWLQRGSFLTYAVQPFKASLFSLMTAGSTAAGAASSAGISTAGDAGRFSIAILGEGNAG